MISNTDTTITLSQKKHFRTEYTDADGNLCVFIATVRYDDRCKNGHNTFSITGEIYDRAQTILGEANTKLTSGKTLYLGSCGCLHADIAKHFPELAPYIKWHLTSSDGPMYYIANSMYHAEVIPKEQGRYFAYLTEPTTGTKKMLKIVNEETKSELDALHGDKMIYEPYYNRAAKDANLEAARSCAVWPDAQLEDFTKEKLIARLPTLMKEFKRDVEKLGFTY